MNKVFLIGRLTREPELRYTTSGTPVCQVNIAVNRIGAKENEQQADFINVVVWDKMGENLAKYQTKGSQIAVEGKIQTRNYDGNDGKKVYVTEVVASNIQYLDSKKENNNTTTTNDLPIQNNDTYSQLGNSFTAEEIDTIKDEDLPF